MLWDILQQYQLGTQFEKHMSLEEKVKMLQRELTITRRMLMKLTEAMISDLGIDPTSLRLDLSEVQDLMDDME